MADSKPLEEVKHAAEQAEQEHEENIKNLKKAQKDLRTKGSPPETMSAPTDQREGRHRPGLG